ncbi:hypothetical protein SAMN05421840_10989 [Shewanella morhuae]|uniref:hypothetical protein n=1 Tax=Shewanella morhuae TaxID=365591 RepID=UPI000955276E|nr:hypothetical protein [Shewanella morhuae]SIR12625.1 hypothetical protein SAMN05421840_10989 [Shewanella morhuae]
MTYCVAWKTNESAYLIADSAVTKGNELSEEKLVTSFGEKQGKQSRNNKYVYEKAYKLYSTENVSIGLIGDADFGNSFIELLLLQIECSNDVKSAINRTLLNYQYFNEYPDIQIVIGLYESGPKLYTIDNKASPYVEYDNDYVVFGSQSEDLETYTKSFYNSFIESWKNELRVGEMAHEFLLIKMLALLQVYGMHNYTLDDGIGGAYTGTQINNSGVHTQPDICYIISGESTAFDTKMLTSVHVENDHFCIINTATSSVLIPNMGVNDETGAERLKSSLITAIDTFDSGKFKYYIFLNFARHSAVIVNMECQLHHKLLSLDIRDEVKGTIGLIVSEELQSRLNVNYEPIVTIKDAQIMFIPYIPAQEEKISLIEERIKKMRVSKFYTEEVDEYKYLILDNHGRTIIKWFYGTLKTIFPFIKHYRKEKHIRIVKMSTDLVVLEYINGEIDYPDMGDDLSMILEKFVDKKCNRDLYLFEFMVEEDDYHTLNILANDYDTAHKEAIIEIESTFANYWNFMFVGIKFYHPAYLL